MAWHSRSFKHSIVCGVGETIGGEEKQTARKESQKENVCVFVRCVSLLDAINLLDGWMDVVWLIGGIQIK